MAHSIVRLVPLRLTLLFLALLCLGASKRPPTDWYPDRASFLAAVGDPIVDNYEAYPPATLTDEQMNALSVIGVTYETLSYLDGHASNSIMPFFQLWDGTTTTAYCNGCNGNFRLGFLHTPVTVQSAGVSGVYGVAMDVPVSSCPWEGCTLTDGQAIIEFGDRTVVSKTLPFDPSRANILKTPSRRSSSA